MLLANVVFVSKQCCYFNDLKKERGNYNKNNNNSNARSCKHWTCNYSSSRFVVVIVVVFVVIVIIVVVVDVVDV